MFPAILGLQLALALVAGFIAGYHPPNDWGPVKAGLGTNLMATLAAPGLAAVAVMNVLPAPCGEDAYPIGVFVVTLILFVGIGPAATVGGAGAGWLGGRLARLTRPVA
jgi:hypothetical protein